MLTDDEILKAIPEGAHKLIGEVQALSENQPALAIAMLALAAAAIGYTHGLSKKIVFEAFRIAWKECDSNAAKEGETLQ